MSSATSSRKDARPVAGTRAWRSLGARLALWYAVVTLVSFAAVALLFALRMHAWVDHEGQKATETALERYRVALENGGTEALRTMLEGDTGRRPSLALRVTDEHAVEIVQLFSDDASHRVVTDLHEGASSRPSPPTPPRDWHVAVARVSQGRQIEIALHDDAAPRLLKGTREISWFILACGLGSIVLGAFVITRRALRPLNELALATHNILESGDLALRVPERGTADDLDQLAVLFNRMLARNETLVRAMKESLDNVAHDLRTPLTRLRAGAELALHAPTDPAKSEEALADVLEESDRVLGMLTTLMDITGAETGAMHLEKRPEDLGAIAREAVDLYEHVSSERGVHVVTNLATGVEVSVDRRRILQVCANLIDNAVKYTPAGGNVEVSVTRDGASGIFAISDTGIGIPSEDHTRVWDRLFRGDKSRTEHGLGLGLSLVKAVVEAHGGVVSLRSTVGTGSTFEVKLPTGSSSRGAGPRGVVP